MMREAQPSLEIPKGRELIESLLSIEGSMDGTYNRFYNYSPRNIGFLAMQGCAPEPVATFNIWQELGRHVKRGEKAYSILRPIQVKIEAPEGSDEDPKMIRRFKVVRALFAASQTAGDDLPPYEPRDWSKERALDYLQVEEVPFASYDGNSQGFSFDRKLAINPVARYPFKTLLHELGHITAGHTSAATMGYEEHRGIQEFQAESIAHLALKSLGVGPEHFNEAESRSYIQGWIWGQEQNLTEQHFSTVLNSTKVVLEAGYVPEANNG